VKPTIAPAKANARRKSYVSGINNNTYLAKKLNILNVSWVIVVVIIIIHL